MTKNNAREQIIAKLKDAQNVLIAVSDNPSVDELAAALALTLAINKADKHATAVASGEMPDALEFLNPNKTFETSVDSLRDFIIALNKEKADHLRYKLVGDHVKIFITPYRSIITEQDLEFEQGDFNVDMVLALGVSNKDHLDGALAAHGRIFHDASVGVLTVGENSSDLSDLNWQSEDASSLSEMALELIESDSIGKKSLNKSVSTAILTGIVAETERFSNEKANAKVMNLASKLIMAGADQQLVISKLREAEEKQSEFNLKKGIEDQTTNPKTPKIEEVKVIEAPKKDASVLTIEREKPSEEDELENSLNTMNVSNTTNVFEDLKAKKSPEFEAVEKLAVDFPATANTGANVSTEAEKVMGAPEFSFEETPQVSNNIEAEAQQVEVPNQIKTPVEELPPAPQVEVVPDAEPSNQIPAMPTQPSPEVEEIPQVIAPVENFAPEIPTPAFEQQSAFVAEKPVDPINFKPAQQTEISNSQSFDAPEILNEPQQEPKQFETAPDPVKIPNQPETPKFGAREYVGDDYYHPEQAQALAQNLSSGSIHDTNANDVPPIQPGVSSHGIDLVPPTLGVSASDNFNPAPNIDAPAQNFENNTTAFRQPAQNFGGFPPPVPDFSSMPLPPELPPVPDFGGIDFNAMPAPAQPIGEQDFAFEPTQTTPDVAQGIAASSNNIMTDQIYQDPAQFKIPGM